MTGSQDLFIGHAGRRPLLTEGQKPVNGCVPLGLFLVASGNQVGDSLPVPGYGDGLALLDVAQYFGKARLGIGGLNFSHETNQSI